MSEAYDGRGCKACEDNECCKEHCPDLAEAIKHRCPWAPPIPRGCDDARGDEVARLTNELDELRGDHTDLLAEHGRLTRELAGAKAEVANYRADTSAADAEFRAMKIARDAAIRELAEMKAGQRVGHDVEALVAAQRAYREACAERDAAIRERDEAQAGAEACRSRLRRCAQVLIDEIGATGPEDGDVAAERAAIQIHELKARLRAIETALGAWRALAVANCSAFFGSHTESVVSVIDAVLRGEKPGKVG